MTPQTSTAMTFETKVPGKWILAGEHSVLRGVPALVFPLWSRALTLNYQSGLGPLKVTLQGEHGEELQALFWEVIERACEMQKISRTDLKGQLTLSSTIPVGAGLGASAALCVAVGKWFQHLKLVNENDIYEFARTLENLFHGESSGVDIAVALSGKGIRFVRNGERILIEPKWTPNWFVSYSGKRGVTLECVNKVKALISANPELGKKIDDDMGLAVQMAEQALAMSEVDGLPKLKEALDLANSCFERWGLCVDSHLTWLREQGAYAVKPTGSGGGGYALSLWKALPPESTKNLVPAF